MNQTTHNKDVYNQIAQEYRKKRSDPQKNTWNELLEVPAIEAILKASVNGKLILDLGCGTGLLTQKIKNWGGQVIGIDPAEKMIELATLDSPEIDFKVGPAEALPFGERAFDVVASSLVMHYIQDLTKPFSEVSRVLKPNGTFVFSMHHPFQESFKREKIREENKVVMQPYFHNDAYFWKMCGGELLSFHHTFENIVSSLASAGLYIRQLIECRPSPTTQSTFTDYDFTSAYPTFCVFEASKKS